MSHDPRSRSGPREFPPLWSVPLLLIAAIVAVVYVGMALGLLGLLGAGLVVFWLQRRADAYVRDRDTGH